MIRNPLTIMKEKKEAEKRRKEEEERRRAEKRKVEQRNSIIALGVMFGVCIIACLIGSIYEHFHSESANIENPVPTVSPVAESNDTVELTESTPTPTPESSTATSMATKEDLSEKTLTEDEKGEIESASSEIAAQASTYQEISSLSVNSKTEYAHIESDTVVLGNGETATIEVKAAPAGLTPDDIFVYFDSDFVNVTTGEIIDNSEYNTSTLSLTVSCIQPGSSEIIISSSYDIETKGDEAMVYSVPILGLDADDGRRVYITYQGEKYHFSSTCAGEGAYATTLRDAQAYEYKPCGKCAS